MRIKFEEVKLTAEKSVKCTEGCGRTLKRRKKFWQTINPFNTNKDGSMKDRQEIYAKLREKANIWKQEKETCSHCGG